MQKKLTWKKCTLVLLHFSNYFDLKNVKDLKIELFLFLKSKTDNDKMNYEIIEKIFGTFKLSLFDKEIHDFNSPLLSPSRKLT